MRELVEFRIPEETARKRLGPGVGETLGDSVRRVVVSTDDPLFERIGQLERRGPLFVSWNVTRRYKDRELETCGFLHVRLTSYFEPEGESCGTIYDDSAACPRCGAGRKQVSELVLDLRKAPRKDLASTIADEWTVSQRFAEVIVEAGSTGIELRPVRHRAYHEDEPVDLAAVPSGRQLLRAAAREGLDPSGWSFWVWLNADDQRELADRAWAEHAVLQGVVEAVRRPAAPPPRYQLHVTSQRLRIAPATVVGIDPFDLDERGEYRCPHGHVIGLNLISEVSVRRDSWDGSDVCVTEEILGVRRGVLVPAPLLLVSPRFWRVLRERRLTGFRIERAHLV